MRRLAVLGLAIAASAQGQPPRPLEFDPRIETLEWRSGVDLPLRTTAGGNLVMIFGPGEVIQSVIVGDPSAIEVQVAPQADSLTVRTVRRPADASIAVHTQLRDYRFKVAVGPANDVAYAVRFGLAATAPAPPASMVSPVSASQQYGLKGEPSLRPKQVSDDGLKTYIEWQDDQALPAMFALNALGEEETVDSYMRGGLMIIDRTYPRLIFRIGKRSAQASRIEPGKGK